MFEGKTTLKDFYRIINISGENFENKKGEADTVAGFIIENTGSLPNKGEKINFEKYIQSKRNRNGNGIIRRYNRRVRTGDLKNVGKYKLLVICNTEVYS